MSTALSDWGVAVKANIDLAGIVTHAGSPALLRQPAATSDSPIVRHLRASGVTRFHQVGMHELAFGVTGINHALGTPQNPTDSLAIPGGSSSGSAVAVASGQARLGIGTDTGGSVRIPAAMCGIVGLKLPYSTELLGGVFPLSPTLDHLGMLTRDLDDMEHAATALSTSPLNPAHAGDIQFIVRSDSRANISIDNVMSDVCDAVAPQLADQLEAAVLPDVDYVHDLTNVIMFFEALAVHRQRFGPNIVAASPDVRARLEQAREISTTEYRAALTQRKLVRARTVSALEPGRVIVEPTVLTHRPALADAASAEVAGLLVKMTRLANASHLPALTMPVTRHGQRVSIQITATSVSTALRAARLLEDVLA